MSKRVLILSGPTHEYIDPVRFIGNASSGKMGKAIAEEAARRGYQVEFVTGPVAEESLPAHRNHVKADNNIHIHKVTSAEEMLAAAQHHFQTSKIIIFAAAVADYAPSEKRPEKMAKSDNDLVLRLCPTPDIARKTYPNYPRLPNIVQVDDTGSGTGADVTPNGDGLFRGHVARWVAGSLDILEDCWIRFVDDHDNNNGSVTVTNQDYFYGRLSGVETSGGTQLAIYLTRKGEGGMESFLENVDMKLFLECVGE